MLFLWVLVFVFFAWYSLRYLSLKLYISSIKIVMVQSVWHSLSLRNNLQVRPRKANNVAIILWAKPFGCEKLNKRDFELLSFLSSLYCSLLAKLKIWQTAETYSPQTFSVTAAVVAPAVVISLNSLMSSGVLIKAGNRAIDGLWGRFCLPGLTFERKVLLLKKCNSKGFPQLWKPVAFLLKTSI